VDVVGFVWRCVLLNQRDFHASDLTLTPNAARRAAPTS
jgi:hypothetical protein